MKARTGVVQPPIIKEYSSFRARSNILIICHKMNVFYTLSHTHTLQGLPSREPKSMLKNDFHKKLHFLHRDNCCNCLEIANNQRQNPVMKRAHSGPVFFCPPLKEKDPAYRQSP